MSSQDHIEIGVKFDEAVIAEHDKERGTRQKIHEPKTPYHPEDESNQSSQDTH